MRVAAISGLVFSLAGWLLTSVGSATAQGSGSVALTVDAESKAAERCFDVGSLQQRIAHYGEAKLARASELRLELKVESDAAELFVYRGSTLVARRKFGGLPAACVDRRDVVALSIALALEGVIRELEPAAARSEPPASSSPSEPAEPTDDAAASNGGASESTSRAETRASADRERAVRQPDPVVSTPAPAAEPPQPSAAEPDQDRGNASDPAEEIEDVAAVSGGRSPLHLSLELHLGGRFLAEALPSLVWMGELGAAIWLDRRFGVELSGIASSVGTAGFEMGQVESRLVGGQLLGCYRVDLAAVAAHGCAGAILAASLAHGRDYPVAFPDATMLWAAAAVRLAVVWPATKIVSVRAVIQGHANLVRPASRVRGSSDELSAFWLGGSGGLDLVVSFD